MGLLRQAAFLALIGLTTNTIAQEMTALSCSDFRPTNEALERFPDLAGACEGIVDRDGELYAKFPAIVRRASGSGVTLYLPSTNHTFRATPDSSHRVLVDGRKTRARDLVRGQEIRIYLAVNEFAKPDIQEVAFVTEEDIIVGIKVERVAALPTTASAVPMAAAVGVFLLGFGLMMRRRRLRHDLPLLVVLSAVMMSGLPVAKAETEIVQKPGKVVTAVVRSMAIVEAVNKDTRELNLINASGERFTVVADDAVQNFDQIEPRDRIVTEYLESVILLAVPADTPALGNAAAVELAPLGEKPGIAGVKSFVIKATVEAINVTDRIATLRYEDGYVTSVKVADRVDLDTVDVGDEVRLRVTQAMAISVVKADIS
jgi:hypothetical protein